MLVVIDTTETFQDFRLSGPNWVLLAEFLRRNEATLVVPDVVVDETVNHYAEKLAESAKKLSSALDTLNRFLPNSSSISCTLPDTSTTVELYKQALAARLRELGAISHDYGDISLKKIVGRALARKKTVRRSRAARIP